MCLDVLTNIQRSLYCFLFFTVVHKGSEKWSKNDRKCKICLSTFFYVMCLWLFYWRGLIYYWVFSSTCSPCKLFKLHNNDRRGRKLFTLNTMPSLFVFDGNGLLDDLFHNLCLSLTCTAAFVWHETNKLCAELGMLWHNTTYWHFWWCWHDKWNNNLVTIVKSHQ